MHGVCQYVVGETSSRLPSCSPSVRCWGVLQYVRRVHRYVAGESCSMFVGSIGTLLESPPVVYLRVDYRYVAGNEDNRKVQ